MKLNKVALHFISNVSTQLQPFFNRHHFQPVLNLLHLRRRGDACCGYQVSSQEMEINACVNNTSVLCVCASYADAQWFIIHQLKADLKITSVFMGCIHTISLIHIKYTVILKKAICQFAESLEDQFSLGVWTCRSVLCKTWVVLRKTADLWRCRCAPPQALPAQQR